MKVSATVLVLYSAMICIYGANLRTVQLHEEGQASRIALIDTDLIKKESRTVTTLKESDLVCPKSPSTSPDAPIRDRALCPWQVNTTYDENRLPTIIEEAVCRCNGCLDVGTCVPNYAFINTLRKTQTGDFETQILKVAVACHCVLPLNS